MEDEVLRKLSQFMSPAVSMPAGAPSLVACRLKRGDDWLQKNESSLIVEIILRNPSQTFGARTLYHKTILIGNCGRAKN